VPPDAFPVELASVASVSFCSKNLCQFEVTPRPCSRTWQQPANLTSQMPTGWTGKLNKKFMQISFTLDLVTTSTLERMGHSRLTKFRMILGKG
jgi:hypothetical protein